MSRSKSASTELVFVGLDVHKNSITAAVVEPGGESPVVDRFFHDEASIRRFVGTFKGRDELRVYYEAGPTGYELQRLLTRLGVSCEVIAPSLTPVAPGARVKTDGRDARRLAHLYRAGELTAVHVPTPEEEAIRDLARQRGDLVLDRVRARHRLSKFLLRHGEVFRGGIAQSRTTAVSTARCCSALSNSACTDSRIPLALTTARSRTTPVEIETTVPWWA